MLQDSFSLGLKILDSGYRPTFIVGIWRGGSSIGIAVQELFEYFGHPTDHIAIRTSLYEGIEERAKHVNVHGLAYLERRMNAEDSLLIVDDVHDSGLSVQQVIIDLKERCRRNTPDIRIAMPYFKPANNKTDTVPDYYLYGTEKWLVFPHELQGLTTEELLEHKPGIAALKDRLL